MTRAFALILLLAACQEQAAPEGAEVVPVPSGRLVWLQDVISNAPGAEGSAMRFRFVAPGLAAADDWSADMEALCTDYALSRAQGTVPVPRQVVISVAGEAVPFGEAAPDVVQFFEAYRIENASCIWEIF